MAPTNRGLVRASLPSIPFLDDTRRSSMFPRASSLLAISGKSSRRLRLTRDISQRSLELDIKNKLMSEKPRKSVTFSNQVRIRDHDHVFDFTDEEFYGVWMADHELQEIKQEAYHTLKLHKKGKLSKDSQEFCIRGLESLVDGQADLRQSQGFKAVMKTQLMVAHIADHEHRADMIAQVYRRVAAESHTLATEMGRGDFQDASS